MQAQLFHIKVALLGHVSVGKTTILNALFQDKFSEVSMKRTTAGINHFRVTADTPATKNTYQPSAYYDYDIKSSQETHSQITKDNSILREKNIIKETIFDIKLDKHLFEMRGDTCLCIVDIPGINEAHSSEKYTKYVKKYWDTFDCVVVVMDAVQGVNTEEQVKLLHHVKNFQKTIRKQPVIVLCNKVDDPDDKELQELVNEVQAEVESVFSVAGRTSALQHILSNIHSDRKQKVTKSANINCSPAFIPISGKNAFLYRAASRLSFDEFKNFNKDFVDEIGREEFGRFKWKKLSSIEQYEQVYRIVSDPVQYKERLAVSNFDKFLVVLGYFVGGEKNQLDFIFSQLEIELDKLMPTSNISDTLSSIYDKYKVLNKPTNQLQDRFWELYEKCEENAIQSLENDPFRIKDMHTPMKELITYESKLHQRIYEKKTSLTNEDRIDDENRIIASMTGLVRRVCNVAIVKMNENSSWEHKWRWYGSYWKHCNKSNVNHGHDRHPDGNLAIHWRWEKTKKVWVHVITGYESNGNENPAMADWEWNTHVKNEWYNKYTGIRESDRTRHPAGDLESHWKWNVSTNKWTHTITKFSKEGAENQNPAIFKRWCDFSPYDKNIILSSILCVIHNRHFSKYFGAEIAQFVWMSRKPGYDWQQITEYLKGEIKDGKFVPSDPVMYERIVNIRLSTNFESHDHWGHVAWMFCEFMEAREMAASLKSRMQAP